MKKIALSALTVACVFSLMLGAACTQQAQDSTSADQSAETTEGATDEGTDEGAAATEAETADAESAEAPEEMGGDLPEIAPDLPASDGITLVEYHESIGQDISGVTEVSYETCGECHGSAEEIVTATDGFLTMKGAIPVESANPHANHYTSNLACDNCHRLDAGSTMYCWSCHDWELSTDNGTWGER
ncbi:cytochrome c3 family protein [Slackia heliotrinireducens]|uniref:Tetrahaem cytochrome domain-containing protein n=1 Tax=Slackia heliotrinireducens (strain ATCC 29202 / DSM 20476 / NCTC 11029 / RHS 1) TaxID=471855 RepID=C7N276_SLAHD|nr:cytochrome c3 family protein [Slackia heliotrinireducens]ACV21382.1 hypothetical protein Shel_03150 [Slackia heliotrinireducens DSM 20476]